jgi:predicted nucleotidyltransferase
MAKPRFPVDFRELLKLLNSKRVRYLLIGGYAVTIHGYPRSTVDIDIWISRDRRNAEKIVEVLDVFGFGGTGLTPGLFEAEDRIVRMGIPPHRIEFLTHIDGVEFEPCYANKDRRKIDGIQVDIISLDDLKKNKRASGRNKDLADLDNLPGG